MQASQMIEIALINCSADLTKKITCAFPNLGVRMSSFDRLSDFSICKNKFDLIFLFHSHSKYDVCGANHVSKYLPKNIPVIAIVDDDQLSCSVHLLNEGVDRCLSSSCNDSYFAAVIRALIRRFLGFTSSVSQYGVLIFNHETKRTWVCSHEIFLTKRESQVLEILLKKVGKIISKREFIDQMEPDSAELNESAVEVYMHRLRKKIKNEFLPVKNIKRCGYLLSKCSAFSSAASRDK
jgi:DNA-binding response OmpR family regulator